ncbi:hypothetical protein BDU57DRAFT_531921 [Ampelomyces quisqualis]|uniref:Uncharacterized protein n=1 Tax=Ampelomyces quisqualis TaxID=50730 RepID=A0A6A5QBI6_AMPQU|nr:hypothetical protein BDU57DRAFT_531921 [Ampelomyces quisqualis]
MEAMRAYNQIIGDDIDVANQEKELKAQAAYDQIMNAPTKAVESNKPNTYGTEHRMLLRDDPGTILTNQLMQSPVNVPKNTQHPEFAPEDSDSDQEELEEHTVELSQFPEELEVNMASVNIDGEVFTWLYPDLEWEDSLDEGPYELHASTSTEKLYTVLEVNLLNALEIPDNTLLRKKNVN